MPGDRFLDGRVVAQQPLQGFRSGLDAVMLAAAVPAGGGEIGLELGSGAGVASLCVAARVPNCFVTGVELVQSLVDIANRNAEMNNVAPRVRFEQADVLALPARLRRDFDHVFCNPPFHGDDGKPPPEAERALALKDFGELGAWLTAGLKRVRSGGTFTAILRADRLGEALSALPDRGVTIFPLWPRADEPAKRILVQARKDSRAPPILQRGLVLHETDGRYTEAADAILRQARSLALAGPSL